MASLQALLDDVIAEAVARFSALAREELALTVHNLRTDEVAHHRGEERIYPASVVKLFYLVCAHRWLEDGRVDDSAELRRALHDMIVDSSNDATHYVIDVLTGTTSGPELPEESMQEWSAKRNAINDYFKSIGFHNLNINQKPWGEGPYGRERIFVGEDYGNRNMLTTSATARLLAQIVRGQAISTVRSDQMMKLLERDAQRQSDDPDDQASKFSGAGVPLGTRLWSKAGWTSSTRHDAAYLELPSGMRLTLVIFTTNHAREHRLIPFIVSKILSSLA